MTENSHKRWTTKELNTAIDLWDKGLANKEIARALNRTPASVKRFIDRNRSQFQRRRQNYNDKYTRLDLLITTFLYKKLRAEAEKRNTSMAIVVSEILRDKLLRNIS